MAKDIRCYVVQTIPGRDDEANRILLKRAIETIWPFECVSTRFSHSYRSWCRPVFPGYIFVMLTPGRSADEVLEVPGVRDIIRGVDRQFIRLPIEELEAIKEKFWANIRRSFDAEPETEAWAVGDWVPAPSGPIIGMPCKIDSIDKSGSISASIGSLRVTFDVSDIDPPSRKNNSSGRPKAWPSMITHSNFQHVKSRA